MKVVFLNYILLCLLILFVSIFIVELPIFLLKIKKTKTMNVLSYLIMASISFVIGQYLFSDYRDFTRVLSLAFIAIGFLSIFKKSDK